MGGQERYEFLDYQQLLTQIAAGNEYAFKELFKRYSTSVSSVAFSILQHEQGRQEVLQEVFIKVWLHRDILPE